MTIRKAMTWTRDDKGRVTSRRLTDIGGVLTARSGRATTIWIAEIHDHARSSSCGPASRMDGATTSEASHPASEWDNTGGYNLK